MNNENLTLDDVLNQNPLPWGAQHGDRVGLNPCGYRALTAILLTHEECFDSMEALAEFARKNQERNFHASMAKAAGRFIELHDLKNDSRPSCCVPNLNVIGLNIFMAMFKAECEQRAFGGNA